MREGGGVATEKKGPLKILEIANSVDVPDPCALQVALTVSAE